MPKKRVKSPRVHEPPAKTFSQALRKGNHLFIAGQTARDPKGKVVGKGDAIRQARQVFRRIQALVEAAGGTLRDVLKLTVYITDIRDAAGVRAVRKEFFKGDFPTSTLLCVAALADPDYLVEIEAEAILDD